MNEYASEAVQCYAELQQIERDLMDLSLRLNGMSTRLKRETEADMLSIARALWEKLGEVPAHHSVGGGVYTEGKFLHFPSGTNTEAIWRWFETAFDLSVAEDLMGLK